MKLIESSLIFCKSKFLKFFKSMKIALAQFKVVRGDPATNITQIREFAAESKAQGAQALFLPEMCTTGFDWQKNASMLKHLPGDLALEKAVGYVQEAAPQIGMYTVYNGITKKQKKAKSARSSTKGRDSHVDPHKLRGKPDQPEFRPRDNIRP